MKKVVLLTLIALSFVGCNPQQQASKRTSGSPRSTISTTTNGVFTQSYCGNNLSNVGTIYDQSYTGNFEARVKALLSATIDPLEIGQISSGPNDQTGVRFQGQIKLESNGTVNLAQTTLTIKVYDTYVLQNPSQYQAIPIEFTSASSGQFNSQTGQGYVVFKDQYGEIRFDGNLSGDYFSGQVSFANTTNVTGGAAASGVLGQFYVARCGIIK